MVRGVDQISSLIIDEYLQKKGIFNTTISLLEYQCPKNIIQGSKEHANFYFYLIFNDHGTKSINLYKKFKEKYLQYNKLFHAPYIVKNFNQESIYEHLSNLGLRYPKQAAKSWIDNSQKLLNEYEGEAIKMFTSTNNALALFNTIKSFRGYGAKTSGLLLRVIVGIGFNKNLYNIQDVPLPVDIHDSRIAYYCDLYKPKNVTSLEQIYSNPSHIKKIEKIWRQSAYNIQIAWEVLDRALWLLGSQGCAHKKCSICPIKKICYMGQKNEGL